MDWLSDQLRLGPGQTVLDLGAGTGKLTLELLRTGADVIALEPIGEMAALIPTTAPRAQVVASRAEATGLATASVDAVTAGQSFHWFANLAALSEIHRVLKPAGGFGIVWNRRDLAHTVWEQVDRLIEPLRSTEPTYRDAIWRGPFEESGLFGPLRGASYPHSHSLTPAELVDRVVSISFVAGLDEVARSGVASQVLAIAEAAVAPGADRLVVPYQTDAWVTFARR